MDPPIALVIRYLATSYRGLYVEVYLLYWLHIPLLYLYLSLSARASLYPIFQLLARAIQPAM